MRKDRFAQRRELDLPHHRDLDHRHELSSFDSQNRATQDLLSGRVDYYFHHASRLADLNRARNVRHRHLRDFDVSTGGARLALAYAHAPQLWVDKDRIGHRAIGGGGLTAFDEV